MTTINIFDKTVELHHAAAIFSSYGHKKITVRIAFNGEYKNFSAVTNFMPATDAAEELEGDDRYAALYDCINTDIEDSIYDWILDIEENA